VRLIAHLSDLHFGRERRSAVAALQAELQALAPDLVIVSGDLTQRARAKQFVAARDFLCALPGPTLTLPGNHDLPLYDVPRRAFDPLGMYRRFIARDLCPYFYDDELAVLALNTATASAWREGRVTAAQADLVRERFRDVPAAAIRILVTHHPLLGQAAGERGNTVAGRDAVLAAAADCGADVFLSGHTHVEHAAAVDLQRGGTSHSVLALEAGTAVSDRTRGAGDSINVLKTSATVIELEVRTCRDGLCTPTMHARFARTSSPWQAA